MAHISYTTGTHALPYICILALGPVALVQVRIYQDGIYLQVVLHSSNVSTPSIYAISCFALYMHTCTQACSPVYIGMKFISCFASHFAYIVVHIYLHYLYHGYEYFALYMHTCTQDYGPRACAYIYIYIYISGKELVPMVSLLHIDSVDIHALLCKTTYKFHPDCDNIDCVNILKIISCSQSLLHVLLIH